METIIGGKEYLCMATSLLLKGETVAFPTETVYGLGAVATNSMGVKKIFEAKGRPADNPLIVHIAGADMIEDVAIVNETAKMLFNKFSPGPLTLVLPKKEGIPYEVTAGLDTVGVRIPDHSLALQLIRAVGKGIAAPSANTSSRVSPSRAKDVLEDMAGKIPLILDGGDCKVGIESTVLDLTKEIPIILRPGAITAEMLLEVLPQVSTFSGEIKVAEAPGMKYKHYAPKVPCFLAKTPKAAADYVCHNQDKKVAVLATSEFFCQSGGVGIDLGVSVVDMEKNIYAAMRDAEKAYDVIIIESPTRVGVGASVFNRISKASAGKFVGEEE